MYIKELEIDNFKSFASKVTIPLLPGFTAIAGPNGSGKSNIIDSILFCLGLTSNSALRTDQGAADLITNHNKRNEASVKVTFCTDDNEHEFSIKRYIKKGKNATASSYYYNDKQTTLTQIHAELSKYNISPNSYNVIMQGDVTSITKCSDKERRTILDEVAGTADFDRKIKLALEQIQSVEDRIANTNILMSAIDEQIERLKQQREVALKYKALKDEKTELETKIQSAKYFDTKRSLELLHQNVLEATKRKKELTQAYKLAESKINDTKIKFDEINAAVKAQGEEKQLEVKKLAEEKKGEIDRKQNAIAHCEKTILDNLKSIDGCKNGIEVQKKEIEKNKASIEEKQEQLKTLEEQLAQKKETLASIINEMMGLNKSADEHIQNRNKLKKDLDALKDSETELIKEQLPVDSKYKNNEEKIQSTKENLDKLLASAKVFDDEKDKLTLQIETLEKEVKDCKDILTKTFEELDKTKNEKEYAYREIQQAQKRIALLEANKKAYKSGGNLGVQMVLEAHIEGVHDTLAQLADVEADYINAINVAMGARAQSIVVDSQDVAYRSIQLLRSRNGRASFIPLDIIKKAPTRLNLPKEKGVIDFAVNLIDFDDKYIDAFYFALSDTIVVEDEACAKKLAGKYRVVTLDGDITEKSGLITGGAVKKSNLFDKAQERELEKYKKALKNLEEEVVNLDKKQKDLERRLDDIRTKHSTSTNTLSMAKLELKNLITNNTQAQDIIEKGQTQLKELKEENKKLARELDLFEKRHIKLADEITKTQSELEEVEKLIDEGELKKLKEKTQGVEDEIKSIEKEIMVTQNGIERDETQIKFQQNQITMRENDIEKLTKDNVSLNSDKDTYKSEIDEIKVVLEGLEKEIEELGKNLKELQEKRDEVQEALLNAKTAKNKAQDDLDRLAVEDESYKAARRELEPMMDKIIEELKEAGINPNTLEKCEISLDEINSKISKLQKKMDDLGDVNMRALTEFDEAIERQNENKQKVEVLQNEKDEIKTRMNGYQGLKKETFLEAYHAIDKHFREVFAELSQGKGRLCLENEDDPFQGGLTFSVNIRDKENQRLKALSGGEQSLTAMAFLFAIQRHFPSPFYALDEVDGALDAINVELLAGAIEQQAKTSQYIVISQRKPMIDSADRMIGVTQKDKGVTKISGVKIKE